MQEHRIDRTGQTRALRHRCNAAGNLDPLEQHGRGIVERRVHRVGATGGKALAIEPAYHPLARQPTIGQLAGQGPVADKRTPGGARGDRGGVGWQRNRRGRLNRIGGGRRIARGGDHDHVGQHRVARGLVGMFGMERDGGQHGRRAQQEAAQAAGNIGHRKFLNLNGIEPLQWPGSVQDVLGGPRRGGRSRTSRRKTIRGAGSSASAMTNASMATSRSTGGRVAAWPSAPKAQCSPAASV